jgi:cold shock protein
MRHRHSAKRDYWDGPSLGLGFSRPEQLTGVIKFFIVGKGFGFITESSGSEIFFHIRACAGNREPLPGERVTYTVGEYKGRTEARDVRVL